MGKKKFIFLGLGVGILALGGWWFLRGKKAPDNTEDFQMPELNTSNATALPHGKKGTAPNTPAGKQNAAPGQSGSKPVNITFPIKLKSKGDAVKKIQEALIAKYGQSILPVRGADGDFGGELIKALKSKGFPTTIDQATYNKILALNNPVKPTLPKVTKEGINIAKFIWYYTFKKNFDALITTLQKIKTVTQYNQVNTLFKAVRLNGRSENITEATERVFTDADEYSALSKEFLRMGLKFRNGIWSLEGFSGKQIYSNRETTISSANGSKVNVPADTLLGSLISRDNHKTKFRSLNNQVYQVSTNDTDYV